MNLYIQCTMYKVQCTMYNVHCTMYSVKCTMYYVQCTIYTVQYIIYTLQCAMYIVQCTLRRTIYAMYGVRYRTLYIVQSIMITTRRTRCTWCCIHCKVYDVHSVNIKHTVCRVRRTLCSDHCILYIVQRTIYGVSCKKYSL